MSSEPGFLFLRNVGGNRDAASGFCGNFWCAKEFGGTDSCVTTQQVLDVLLTMN